MHTINTFTALQFSAAFNDTVLLKWDSLCNLGPDVITSIFNSICSNLLDSVCPFKRRTERKWKNNHIQISLEILKII